MFLGFGLLRYFGVVVWKEAELRELENGWNWQKLRLYDVGASHTMKVKFECQGPVLDYRFHDDAPGYSACADHTLSRYFHVAFPLPNAGRSFIQISLMQFLVW